MADNKRKLYTKSPEDTEAFGRSLAEELKAGDVVGLYGDLGAGKTCFVRGLAGALGTTEDVTSPTFTLINEYHGTIPIYHFDLYRLQSPGELEDIGCDDYFFGDGICILEWAEKAGNLLPQSHWKIYFEISGEQERQITTCPPVSQELP